MNLTEFNREREKQLISMKSEKPRDKERFFSVLKSQFSQEIFCRM